MNLLAPGIALYVWKTDRWLRRAAADPAGVQERVLGRLVRHARDTWFGREHRFASLAGHRDFAKAVPIADYVARKDLFERILRGERDVCWPGRIRLFGLTSGTTAGDKYIPFTPEAAKAHFRGGAGLFALAERASPGLLGRLLKGKLVWLGACTAQEPHPGGGRVGYLTGITSRGMPWWAARRREPPLEVASISNYPQRVEAVARCIVRQDVRFIGGLPHWVKGLFDRVAELAGLGPEGALSRLWPKFELLVHGGIRADPFLPTLRRFFRPDHAIRFRNLYSATEAFVAAQAEDAEPGMELFTDNGTFFEFVPLAEWGKPDAPRLMVHEVEPNVPYCLVVSTSAGLWAYYLGDVVRFTSVRPPRLVFAGRHQHFISPFGEHVIEEEVAQAIAAAARATDSLVAAFTVAPLYPDAARRVGAYQVIVEFDRPPARVSGSPSPPAPLESFAEAFDHALGSLNSYYVATRREEQGMSMPEIAPVPRGTFDAWLQKRGKALGQSKVPPCANDRRWADELLGNRKPETESRNPGPAPPAPPFIGY